jgi:DNA-binding CsgD family transcriptional regulator
VDDDPGALQSIAQLLERAGYAVRTFLSANDFLRECMPRMGAHSLLDTSRLPELTSRETEVIELLLAGKTLKEIATKGKVSVQSVWKHRQRVLHKFAVQNEVELLQLLLGANTVQTFPSKTDRQPPEHAWGAGEGPEALSRVRMPPLTRMIHGRLREAPFRRCCWRPRCSFWRRLAGRLRSGKRQAGDWLSQLSRRDWPFIPHLSSIISSHLQSLIFSERISPRSRYAILDTATRGAIIEGKYALSTRKW